MSKLFANLTKSLSGSQTRVW